MNVLVATEQTQGLVLGDENDCIEGELVSLTPPCGRCLPGGARCGCEYLFTGLSSHGRTSTAVVQKRPKADAAAVLAAIRDGLCRDCYPPVTRSRAARELLRIAAAFPVGTIVELGVRGVRARLCTEHQHGWDERGWGALLEPGDR